MVGRFGQREKERTISKRGMMHVDEQMKSEKLLKCII